jgi:hypothetical protein
MARLNVNVTSPSNPRGNGPKARAMTIEFINKSGKSIQTPNMLLTTRNGMPLHMTPDLVPQDLPISVHWPSM